MTTEPEDWAISEVLRLADRPPIDPKTVRARARQGRVAERQVIAHAVTIMQLYTIRSRIKARRLMK